MFSFWGPLYGLIDTLAAIQSGIGIANAGAGLVTGGILTASGVGLIATPIPGVSQAAGYATVVTGLTNIANSSVGLVNSSRNLISAFQNQPANLSNNGFKLIADTYFPGNSIANKFADVADLSLALISGRVTVGAVPVNSYSALETLVPANINRVLDFNAVLPPSSVSSLVRATGPYNASFASSALDTTQKLSLGSTYFDYLNSSANGGFVIYPNKSNSNMMKSVYSK